MNIAFINSMKILIIMSLLIINSLSFAASSKKSKVVKISGALLKSCAYIQHDSCVPKIKVGEKYLPIVKKTLPIELRKSLYTNKEEIFQVEYLEGLVSYERSKSGFANEYQFVFRMLMHEPRAELSFCNTGTCKPEVYIRGKRYALDISSIPFEHERLLNENAMALKANLKGFVIKRVSQFNPEYDNEIFVITDMTMIKKRSRNISSIKNRLDIGVQDTNQFIDNMLKR